MVYNLNAGVAAGAEALKGMQKALDDSSAREKKLEENVKAVTDAANAKVAAAEAKNDANEKKLVVFAGERDAVARQYENIKFWGFTAAGILALLWLGSWALPLLSKSFPALAPISDVLGKVWAPGVQMAHNAAVSLNKDFVGMTEMIKGELSKRMQPEEIAALKKKISDEWMTAADGSAQTIERLKQELRL